MRVINGVVEGCGSFRKHALPSAYSPCQETGHSLDGDSPGRLPAHRGGRRRWPRMPPDRRCRSLRGASIPPAGQRIVRSLAHVPRRKNDDGPVRLPGDFNLDVLRLGPGHRLRYSQFAQQICTVQ